MEAAKKRVRLYKAKTAVGNETDGIKALEEVKQAGCDALIVFPRNFGLETPETLLAKRFDGPTMFVAAAEETGKNLVDGRGDAYYGMLNCSYNLGLRNLRVISHRVRVGAAEEIASQIAKFLPIAPTSSG